MKIGDHLPVNLETLVDTRLLVQANSGGGKSWLLRRLLEQSHGRVQHLVIDPEGEFSTLRERFDYVLAAPRGGDTVAEPRSAKLLAERLLELGVSAILDIYELKAHDRIRFVRGFLEALVDAPKKLWHPAIVVVDEAHVFAPQQGEAESAGAMIDLATRGRKRGFCAVFATQRLSKLHKDAAAECNNKLIGRTGLDVDMKRAADELGLVGREDVHQLRSLEPGEFFAFGPALSTQVRRFRVGDVLTSHPKAGARLAQKAPPPTAKVLALLPQLADLPKEAEERQKSVDDLKKELADTTRRLTIAEKAQPATKVERVEVAMLPEDLVRRLEDAFRTHEMSDAELRLVLREATDELRHGAARVLAASRTSVPPIRVPQSRNGPPPRIAREDAEIDGDVPRAALKILNALAWLETIGVDAPEHTATAFIAGYTVNGHFNNMKGSLNSRGLVEYLEGGRMRLSEEGRALAEAPEAPLTDEEMHRLVMDRLDEPERRLLRPLIEAYPGSVSAEEHAAAAGYTVNGHFNNMRGRLRTLGLIEYPGHGTSRARDILFPFTVR